jgi:hypothetical protein
MFSVFDFLGLAILVNEGEYGTAKNKKAPKLLF